MPDVIVNKAIYCDGVRQTISGDISDAVTDARGRGDCFLWIGLHEPTQEEFDLITGEVSLHPLAVEDAIHAHQRPKLERYGDTLFIVLKPLLYMEETSDIEVGEINLFLGRDFVISVRHGQANPLGGVRRRIESDAGLLAAGPAGVLYAICDEVVDTYSRVSHEIEGDLIALEHRVFSGEHTDVTADIYSLKREVLEFRTAQDPLIPVLEEIVRGRVELCTANREQFRDVLDHLLRVDARIDEYNELLTSVLNAHLALVGREQSAAAMQQNADMRKISSWAALVAVPTMIAGIYGMNFDYMPELHWLLGYPFSLGVMVVAALIVHRLLRKSGWL
ncbi:magnesium and cobalt transport protein CorA [Nonomuraea glycinis]|uniref:Magnesium transport protein CorA n=1 Tax=Nonomuraea glycinis TaxID=2047744 RepID=A0A918A511_9ACTN|nr:magnesium and cobalt transport protein CorA [Nonomuraea glycinis]MCA2175639.1 magnesium and cobalt transport protein CorA [Nonomuraea glycinis]GGP05081.1 magnesium transport protein CorA [Nonomuraea glycinis]